MEKLIFLLEKQKIFMIHLLFCLKPNKIINGDAMKIEEYVPIKTPQIIAETNPLTTSPPKTNNATNANKVVIEVIKVLDKV